MTRTLLVGPLSPVHDALAAAALRAAGLAAQAVPAPTDEGLARARALGNHGQCNPPHYAIGAVLEQARASGLSPADFAARHAWLTLGSCGPCRLAAFPVEWTQILEGAGLGALRMEPVQQLGFIPALAHGRGLTRAVVAALVAADALETVGHRLRPYASDAPAFEAEFEAGVARLVMAVERGERLMTSLREISLSLRSATRPLTPTLSPLAQGEGVPLPRVLLVGEPWTTLTRGAPSYDVARRLEALGAEVLGPTVVAWLRYLAWQHARATRTTEEAKADCQRASTRLAALWRLFSRAVGLREPLENLDHLSQLAQRWYPPEVLGGSSHLELGRALAATEARSVQLVLSLKPFGCLPSSALSDGVLGPLLSRLPGAPAFLALETTGDSHATVDSRLEMALQAATLRVSETTTKTGEGAVSSSPAPRGRA